VLRGASKRRRKRKRRIKKKKEKKHGSKDPPLHCHPNPPNCFPYLLCSLPLPAPNFHTHSN